MGASCNCTMNTINQPPVLNISVPTCKTFNQNNSECPNRQNTLIQFSYNLPQHLDDFNEDFYGKNFVFDSEIKSKSEPRLPDIRVNESKTILNSQELNYQNINIIGELESSKNTIYKLCLTYNKYVLQNRRQNRKKKQPRSQEIRIQLPQKGILKTTSKSFDSLSRNKKVRFNYFTPIRPRYITEQNQIY